MGVQQKGVLIITKEVHYEGVLIREIVKEKDSLDRGLTIKYNSKKGDSLEKRGTL